MQEGLALELPAGPGTVAGPGHEGGLEVPVDWGRGEVGKPTGLESVGFEPLPSEPAALWVHGSSPTQARSSGEPQTQWGRALEGSSRG